MPDETRREVNLLWFRILMPALAVVLFFVLDGYVDPAPAPGEPSSPFDYRAFKHWWMFGDPMTRAEWIGDLNFMAAAGYAFAGLMLMGRMRLGGIAIMFAIVAALGLAAVAALVHLAVTDSTSFPVGGGGLGPIFFCHALAFVAGAGAWWSLRQAAAKPVPS